MCEPQIVYRWLVFTRVRLQRSAGVRIANDRPATAEEIANSMRDIRTFADKFSSGPTYPTSAGDALKAMMNASFLHF